MAARPHIPGSCRATCPWDTANRRAFYKMETGSTSPLQTTLVRIWRKYQSMSQRLKAKNTCPSRGLQGDAWTASDSCQSNADAINSGIDTDGTDYDV